MQRGCFSFQIYPGAEDEYQRRHDEIWPEVLEALRLMGRKNYTIFRSKLTIIGYFELHDVELNDEEKLFIEQVQSRWSKSMEKIINYSTIRGEDAHLFHEVWHMQ